MGSLQLRRGSSTDRLNYTPLEGELVLDTDTQQLYIGDGVTAGGNVVVGPGANITVVSNYSNANVASFLPVFTGNIQCDVLTANSITGTVFSSLPAGNLTGTIPGSVLGNSTTYVGTTAISLNRTSAEQTLTGISSIANGNSNVSITANGNVVISTGPGGVRLTITSTGATAQDNFNVTGNLTAGNISTTGLANIANANVGVATIGTANANVINANSLSLANALTLTGNLTAGNLATGGRLTVTGNANVGNVNAVNAVIANSIAANSATITGNISATGNVDGYDVNVAHDLYVGGNINFTDIVANNVTATSNLYAGNVVTANVVNGTSNIRITANANVTVSANGVANILTVHGNIVGGDVVSANSATIYASTIYAINSLVSDGWVTGNLRGNLFATDGTTLLVNYVSGQVLAPINTTTGTFSGSVTTGNLTGGNITANAGSIFSGNGSGLTNINAGNVIGTVANAAYATNAGYAANAGNVAINALGTALDGNGKPYNTANGTYYVGMTDASGSYDRIDYTTGFMFNGNNVAAYRNTVTLGDNWNMYIGGNLQVGTAATDAGIFTAETIKGSGANALLIMNNGSSDTITMYASNGNISSSGNANIANINLTGLLKQTLSTKTSTTTGVQGQIAWDANYIYVCTATNTWKRVALTAGPF